VKYEEDEIGEACSTNGGEEEAYRLLMGKARGKETTGKNRK
jgi:hypothetical protein